MTLRSAILQDEPMGTRADADAATRVRGRVYLCLFVSKHGIYFGHGGGGTARSTLGTTMSNPRTTRATTSSTEGSGEREKAEGRRIDWAHIHRVTATTDIAKTDIASSHRTQKAFR